MSAGYFAKINRQFLKFIKLKLLALIWNGIFYDVFQISGKF